MQAGFELLGRFLKLYRISIEAWLITAIRGSTLVIYTGAAALATGRPRLVPLPGGFLDGLRARAREPGVLVTGRPSGRVPQTASEAERMPLAEAEGPLLGQQTWQPGCLSVSEPAVVLAGL